MIAKSSRILITGGTGFVGKSVVHLLRKKGYHNLLIPRSKDFDLRILENCRRLIRGTDYIIHLAANVGGIGYNRDYPADLFRDNLLMGINLLHEAYLSGVKKLVSVGTVCAYPKYTPVPFRETSLWDGYPEETNAPYGLAKKMLLVGGQAYRKQYNLNAIYLLPVNMYGPGDNFNLEASHVVPALIQKLYIAKKNNQPTVTVWGTGNASREFLYVDDAARAIVLAFEKYEKADPVNIGSGREVKISELVQRIAKIMKYHGEIVWDKTKPDGQPRRLLSVEKAYTEFEFRAKVNLDTGLKKTIDWYKKNHV